MGFQGKLQVLRPCVKVLENFENNVDLDACFPQRTDFKEVSDHYRKRLFGRAELVCHYNALAKYIADIQLLLENTTFTGIDRTHSNPRTLVLMRTENPAVIGLDPNQGKKEHEKHAGMKRTHNRGINESHSNSRTVVVEGGRLTMLRVPFSRICGSYFWESNFGYNGAQFLGDSENEWSADTNGLTAYYMGKVGRYEKVSKFMNDFKNYEQTNP